MRCFSTFLAAVIAGAAAVAADPADDKPPTPAEIRESKIYDAMADMIIRRDDLLQRFAVVLYGEVTTLDEGGSEQIGYQLTARFDQRTRAGAIWKVEIELDESKGMVPSRSTPAPGTKRRRQNRGSMVKKPSTGRRKDCTTIDRQLRDRTAGDHRRRGSRGLYDIDSLAKFAPRDRPRRERSALSIADLGRAR